MSSEIRTDHSRITQSNNRIAKQLVRPDRIMAIVLTRTAIFTKQSNKRLPLEATRQGNRYIWAGGLGCFVSCSPTNDNAIRQVTTENNERLLVSAIPHSTTIATNDATLRGISHRKPHRNSLSTTIRECQVAVFLSASSDIESRSRLYVQKSLLLK